jgi:F0F1-type ATP synthase membrane subunit b/b'
MISNDVLLGGYQVGRVRRMVQDVEAALVHRSAAMQDVEAKLAAQQAEATAALANAETQAQLELKTAKAQAQSELETAQAKAQSELETAQAKAQSELKTAQAKAQSELETAKAKARERLETAKAEAQEELEAADKAKAEAEAKVADLETEAAEAVASLQVNLFCRTLFCSSRPGWGRATEGVVLFSPYGYGKSFPPAAQRGVFRHRPPCLGSSSSSLSQNRCAQVLVFSCSRGIVLENPWYHKTVRD